MTTWITSKKSTGIKKSLTIKYLGFLMTYIYPGYNQLIICMYFRWSCIPMKTIAKQMFVGAPDTSSDSSDHDTDSSSYGSSTKIVRDNI